MQGCESVCEALGDVAAVLQATGGEGAEQQVGAGRPLAGGGQFLHVKVGAEQQVGAGRPLVGGGALLQVGAARLLRVVF